MPCFADFELPIGWGAGEIRHHAQTQQGAHGGSRRTNPRTTRLAVAASNVRNGYRGVPEFRDVRGTPDEAKATASYVVVLELPRSAVSLADRVLSSTAIEDFEGVRHDIGAATDDPLFGLGAAEVHFHRPETARGRPR